MSDTLETLFKLQDRDLIVLEKRKEVERFESALAERQQAMSVCRQKIDKLTAERKDLVTRRALAERKVSEHEAQVREREKRLQRVRTETELRASQSEAASLRKELGEGEEVLLELMGQVEELEGKIKVLEAEHKEIEEADHRHVADETERIEKLRVELEADTADRNQFATDLEPTIRRRYEQLLAQRSGLAVVAVNDGCCGGCHMRLPPQYLIEIAKTGAVKLCPSCNRILYVRLEPTNIAPID